MKLVTENFLMAISIFFIGTLLSILLKKNSAISTEENETTENTQSLSKVAS